MKRLQVFSSAVSAAVLALLTLWLSACSSTTDAPPVETYTPPTYPTKLNAQWSYKLFADSTGDTTNRQFFETATRIEKLVSTTTVAGKQALVIQGQTQQSGMFASAFDTTNYNATETQGNLQLYLRNVTDLTGTIPGYTVISPFASNWYAYINLAGNVGSTYTVLNETPFTLKSTTSPDTLQLRASVSGRVNSKEKITVQGKEYETFRVTLTTSVSVVLAGSSSLKLLDIPSVFWFANNVGIVRQETPRIVVPLLNIPVTGFRKDLVSITGN